LGPGADGVVAEGEELMPDEVTVHSIIPVAEQLLALEPEELAGIVLECLNALSENHRMLNRRSFTWGGQQLSYPQEHRDSISKALTEAWVWLEREGLIAPRPGEEPDFIFVTRRGKQLKNRDGFRSHRQGDLLPRRLLHPLIATKVWSAFIRGEYDTAVFQAFKEVEVAVRQTGRYPNTLVGVPLMRQAFDPDNGPLSDANAPRPERESLAHLFAGAIGSYKNPGSHRHVAVGPEEAVEMIMLSSHLLKIVESHNPQSTP